MNKATSEAGAGWLDGPAVVGTSRAIDLPSPSTAERLRGAEPDFTVPAVYAPYDRLIGRAIVEMTRPLGGERMED